MTVRLGIAGATGRMGRELLVEAGDRPAVEPVFAVNRDPDVDEVDGQPIERASEFEALVTDLEPDAVVEFTGPASAVSYAESCGRLGVPIVSGTTGLSTEQRRRIEAVGEQVAVVRSSNFSRGIRTLEDLVRRAADALPDYHVEIVESHHAGKRDAPSGTAIDLVDAVDAGREADCQRVTGREGQGARQDSEVGVHAVRAGAVTGEHTVVLAGDGEQLRLEHRAGERRCFAAGAIDAATGVVDADPGVYAASEVDR